MKKYGIDHLELCPRCVDAVPVYLRTISDRFETKVEIHCLKWIKNPSEHRH